MYRQIKGNRAFLLISLFLLEVIIIIIIIMSAIMITNNYFNISNFAYAQAYQTISKITNLSLNIQNVPAKKVYVGDIAIAYRIFGKGDPILLISGSGLVMDTWEPSTLKIYPQIIQ